MIENTRFHDLTELHMKPSGKSDTVRGELIRAVNRIGYRFWNDGDMIGIGYGNETCNAAGRYILAHGDEAMKKALGTIWEGFVGDSYMAMPEYVYEARLQALITATVGYVDTQNPKLDEEATDMWDLYDKDDTKYDEEEEDSWDEEDEWAEDDEDEEWQD